MQDDNRLSDMDGPLAELRDLLADFTTGELTDAQSIRIEQLVVESDAAWRFYTEYMFMHGTIHQEHCNFEKIQAAAIPPVDAFGPNASIETSNAGDPTIPSTEMGDNLLSSSIDTNELEGRVSMSLGDEVDLATVLALDAKSSDVKDSSKDQEEGAKSLLFNFFEALPDHFSQNSFQVFIILSLLLPSAFAFFLFFSSSQYGSAVASGPIVTQTIQADWGGNLDGPVRAGFQLTKGQEYTLKSGLAEVLFPNEARVVLHGPTTFAITNNSLVHLDFGRCVAHVPKLASGFTIEANGTRVVDLGTEFGIETDEAMETDVYVFQGKVELSLENNSEIAKMELIENEGVHTSVQEGTVQHRKINTERFVRTFSGNGTPSSFLVRNASFEQPNFPTEYGENGVLRSRPLLYWSTSLLASQGENQPRHRTNPMVGYYSWTTQDGPRSQWGVTDGNQAALLTLGDGSAGKETNKDAWMFYPFGKVRPQDVGHSLKLQADSFAKTTNEEHDAEVIIAFATGTSRTDPGTIVGSMGITSGTSIWKKSKSIESWVAVTEEMVGQKLYAVIRVKDPSPSSAEDSYLIDNVKVFHYDP